MRSISSLLLLCILPAALAAEGEQPEMLVERGILAMTALRDVNQARVCFRAALGKATTPPRVAAEALWQMSEAYLREGSDEACLLTLGRLTREFPHVQPFATAAAEAAVDLSRDLAGDIISPSPADNVTSMAVARQLKVAIQLQDASETASAARDLLGLMEAMLFEMSIPPPAETKEDQKDRESTMEDLREYISMLQRVATETTSLPLSDAETELLKEMMDRSEMDKEDFNVQRYAAQDAVTDALATRKPERVTAAVAALESLMKPLAEGPEDLAMVQSIKAELVAARDTAKLAGEGKFGPALRQWRECFLLQLESGVAGTQMVLEHSQAVPTEVLPKMAGAILYVESALFTCMSGENLADAGKNLRLALTKLTSLRDEISLPEAKTRLDLAIQHLTEAQDLLKNGNQGRAQELMRAEMYVTR